jgi:hypothetical protein
VTRPLPADVAFNQALASSGAEHVPVGIDLTEVPDDDDDVDGLAHGDVDLRLVPDDDEDELNDAPLDLLPHDVEFDLAMLAHGPLIESAPQQVVGVNFDSHPAFEGAIATRSANAQPAVTMRDDVPKERQFDMAFGAVWGPAGFQTTITIRPQCLFRAEKLMATDSASTPGTGTSIVQVGVGQRIQRPGNTPQGSLTLFFAQNAVADGITFDTAHPWEDIAITVSFIVACTFNATLWGRAVVDQ